MWEKDNYRAASGYYERRRIARRHKSLFFRKSPEKQA
jgi:hypothetical protein